MFRGLPRRQSMVVRPAGHRLGRKELDAHLNELGEDGAVARRLDADVEGALSSVVSLSALTAPLALEYSDRLARPVPMLTPDLAVQVVGRGYVAHMLVEDDPGRVGATEVPVVGTLPPPKKGRPPQDLLSRVVKLSRRSFAPVCALTIPAWEGFVWCLTKRLHDRAPEPEDLVPLEVVDGLARFAWVLRQVDIHYGLDPERA